MAKIHVLDKQTIDQIAAGEVIERPSSVVKELVENAVDAGASAVTVEIKEGGLSYMRITDNGSGIDKEQVPTAFLRHSTSKIRSAGDLASVASLGFRGEALSSIAAVARVELITKTGADAAGARYVIEGGEEKQLSEAGAPVGTTFVVRDLFYNTPARRKFLKAPMTEAGYIGDLMNRLALSHPEISFKFVNNGQIKLHTSGNSSLKDVIYQVYGREITANLIEIEAGSAPVSIKGYIGKPAVSRGNRNYETYFINGRYVKSTLISKGIEDAYKTFMMQHKFPFAVLHFTMDGDLLDVNVHPTKMELRFRNQEELYGFVKATVHAGLTKPELIPRVGFGADKPKEDTLKAKEPKEAKKRSEQSIPDKNRSYFMEEMKKRVAAYHNKSGAKEPFKEAKEADRIAETPRGYRAVSNAGEEVRASGPRPGEKKQPKKEKQPQKEEQLTLFEEKLLTSKARESHRLIGQLFETYWLVEFNEQLYIIDQHAAHEKVLYERTMKSLKEREFTSQLVSPPIILTLSMQEEELLNRYMEEFTNLGFELSPFGGREYAVQAVPDNLFGIARKELLIEMLDDLSARLGSHTPELVLEKIASMSCKAAVKGNQSLSAREAEELIDELLTLDNPYNCPHGRPTIISMTRHELEKKFKRIV